MRKRFSAFLLLLSLVALFACTEPPLPLAVPVSVEGVSLNETSVSILVGATKALSVTIKPAEAENKAVAWLSSDAAIATVSDAGLVTGVAAGTATITVATKEGAKMATCTVTVSAVPVADIEVTGVILDKATADVFVGAALTLVATVAPADATNQAVVWSSSDAAIATVSDAGVVTGVAAGTATITATTVDGGHKATCVVTVDTRIVLVYGAAPHSVTAGLSGSTTASYNAWKGEADPNTNGANGGNGDCIANRAVLYTIEKPYYQFEVAPADESRRLVWQAARQACWDKMLDGGGWRLPRASELKLMYLNKESLGVAAPDFTPFDLASYWSATEYDAICAWPVYFGNGHTFYDNHYKTSTEFRARCVREVSE